MPDINIVKLKIRRGTDLQRKQVVLEQGELGYTTDTKRVFVGDGVGLGGNPVGSVVHRPLSNAGARIYLNNAVPGDIVYERSLLYQLTGTDYTKLSSWSNISPAVDGSTIKYNTDNQLSLGSVAVNPSNMAQSVVFSSGGLTLNNVSGLSANVDRNTLNIINNRLVVTAVSSTSIINSTLGPGMSGGSNTPLTLNVNTNFFNLSNNKLNLIDIPNSSVTLQKLSSGIIGEGLQTNSSLGKIESVFKNVDITLDYNKTSGLLRMKSLHAGFPTRFENITVDSVGRVVGKSTAIATRLSCNSQGSLYNGVLNQTQFTNQTTITGVSSINGITTGVITLTSAGFIGVETVDSGYFAIPIFKFN